MSIIVKDDGYNPTTSLAAAQTLVGTDHVVAIVDNSDVDTSWGPYVKEQGVAVVGGSESDEGYENPDWFVPGATYNNFTAGIAYAAKQLKVKKMADVYCAEVAVCAQSSVDLKAALTKLDIDLSYTSAISFSAPSYTAYCLAAKQSGATALLVGDATAIVNKFVENCASQGYNPVEISGDGTVAISWLAIPGFEGNVDSQPDISFFVHDAATKPMYDALAKYAPGVTTGPNFGEIVIETWAAGVELQTAGDAAHLSASPTAARDARRVLRHAQGHDARRALVTADLHKGQGVQQRVLLPHGDQEQEVRVPQQFEGLLRKVMSMSTLDPKASPEKQQQMFEVMALAKACDERLRKGIATGEFLTVYWPSRGQEAIAAGFAASLRSDDRLVTTYRGLHDLIGKGVSLVEILGEMLGPPGGRLPRQGRHHAHRRSGRRPDGLHRHRRRRHPGCCRPGPGRTGPEVRSGRCGQLRGWSDQHGVLPRGGEPGRDLAAAAGPGVPEQRVCGNDAHRRHHARRAHR